MELSIWVWAGFIVFVALMLVLDLGVFNRKSHVITVSEALKFCAFWVGLALLFNVGIYFFYHPEHDLTAASSKFLPADNRQAASMFLTGYLIELMLSVDNLFVFLMLFSYFRVPGKYQHRVLFWGIIGAVVLRGIFIFAGVELIHRFHWMIYVFGALLIITAIKMLFHKSDDMDPEKNPAVRLLRRFVPISPAYDDGKFFTRVNGMTMATPLLVVLVAVEFTDVIFAVDSIPAIIGITNDRFLIFTSNVFAILGLRSIFFALAGIMGMFRHLDKGLCLVLLFVGGKMMAGIWGGHLNPEHSLFVIVGILTIAIVASIIHEKIDPQAHPHLVDGTEDIAPALEDALTLHDELHPGHKKQN